MKYQNNKKRYDLIIKFNSETYIDLRCSDIFKELADWKKYGTLGFRGFCSLSKEEIEKLIIEKVGLNHKDFQVLSTTRLYVPS